MLRITIKSLRANKIRFALTTFGVVLAVSFVVGALVLGDGLRASFTKVSEDITSGIDLEVRGVAEFGPTPTLPAETVATVASVDGVADAVAQIESADNAVRPIPPDGTPIPTAGPPQLAFAWIDNPVLSAFSMVDGTPPQAGEFTIDVDSAATYDFVVGDTYEVVVPGGREHLLLSGTSSFGADNATLGAVLMQMNASQASELFGIDGITSVAVQVADDAHTADVQAAIAAAVPAAEVVDHETVLHETTSDFTDEINIVGNILLGFGGVALLVSAFIIYNTFAIVLAQRSRELALLRALGAAPRQIRRSAMVEALVVGLVASAVGIVGGIAVAKGIEALFGVMGLQLTEHPTIVASRTVIAAFVVGVDATVLAAIGPARRAATVSPVAVMSGNADGSGTGVRGRVLAGVTLVGVGLVAGAIGLSDIGSTTTTVAAMAASAVAVVTGVVLLSPLAVHAVTALFGWPMRTVAGVAGRLAQRNASRHARRTATTAAALMIGLTLVSAAFLVGGSVKAAIRSAMDRSVSADYIITDDLDEVDFPATLTDDLRRHDIVAASAGVTYFDARVGDRVTEVAGTDFGQIGAVLDLDLQAGELGAQTSAPVVVSTDEADARGIDVGDVITVETAGGARVEVTVVGLFADQTILTQDYVVDSRVLATAGIAPTVDWLAITLADGASDADVDALVAGLSEDHPYASVETAAGFQDRMEGTVDSVLVMLNVMVALAVVIALIGIANTLALSVVERTRELGLVRAVGMTRRQVRRMVRLEAVLVATFGATLGVGLGLLFGLAAVTALPETFSTDPTVPLVPILVVMLVAAGAAVIAAWLPARRAGRLNVLDAVAR